MRSFSVFLVHFVGVGGKGGVRSFAVRHGITGALYETCGEGVAEISTWSSFWCVCVSMCECADGKRSNRGGGVLGVGRVVGKVSLHVSVFVCVSIYRRSNVHQYFFSLSFSLCH